MDPAALLQSTPVSSQYAAVCLPQRTHQREPSPRHSINLPLTAGLALSSSKLAISQLVQTQKDLMLQGLSYEPSDTELTAERGRCRDACWRFNNANSPDSGLLASERARLFREIIIPNESTGPSGLRQPAVVHMGRIGRECVIEAPFNCDYGYNIKIGHNVYIGRHCTIVDPCSIEIGSNVYIGPNVSLLGAMLHEDPRRRDGSKSIQSGSKIIIEDNAWIGAGAIILSGRRIMQGAVVAAGAVMASRSDSTLQLSHR
ncbi:hypothetical protein JX266_014017 [Neoarthrinium moseri]|nr:hypothetical protein JX266_014017 [Neoarthrinium moseri]